MKNFDSQEDFFKKALTPDGVSTRIPVEVVKHESLGVQNIDDSMVRSSVRPGRAVTEPIRAEYNVWDGTWTVRDGQHRIEQALANNDKTIPAKVSILDQRWNKNQFGTYTSQISEKDITKEILTTLWKKVFPGQ